VGFKVFRKTSFEDQDWRASLYYSEKVASTRESECYFLGNLINQNAAEKLLSSRLLLLLRLLAWLLLLLLTRLIGLAVCSAGLVHLVEEVE
jgi:hypothetical protein